MLTKLCIVSALVSVGLSLPLIRPKRAAGDANLDGNYGDNSVFRNQKPGAAGQPQAYNSGYNSQYNDRNMDTLRYTGDIDQYNRNGGYQNYPSNYNSRDGYNSRYNNEPGRNSNSSPYYYGSSTPGYDINRYNNGYNSNWNVGYAGQNGGDRYSDSRYNNKNNMYNENREQNNGTFFNQTRDWFKGVFGRK